MDCPYFFLEERKSASNSFTYTFKHTLKQTEAHLENLIKHYTMIFYSKVCVLNFIFGHQQWKSSHVGKTLSVRMNLLMGDENLYSREDFRDEYRQFWQNFNHRLTQMDFY